MKLKSIGVNPIAKLGMICFTERSAYVYGFTGDGGIYLTDFINGSWYSKTSLISSKPQRVCQWSQEYEVFYDKEWFVWEKS